MKLAAYLEEAGDDPTSACRTLREVGISHVVIRQAWASNVGELSDKGCEKLRKILSDFGIKPVAVFSSIAEVPAADLSKIPEEAVDHSFHLASFFETPMVVLTCGHKVSGLGPQPVIDWLSKVQDKSLTANVLPVMEITSKSHLFAPAEVVSAFSKFPRPKLLYDPAHFILRQNIDPFVKYWALWKSHVAAIDVRDYQIGRGFRPFGSGNAQAVRTVADAIRSEFGGWFFLEPSLGRKYGPVQNKGEVFKAALDSFQKVIDGWRAEEDSEQ